MVGICSTGCLCRFVGSQMSMSVCGSISAVFSVSLICVAFNQCPTFLMTWSIGISANPPTFSEALFGYYSSFFLLYRNSMSVQKVKISIGIVLYLYINLGRMDFLTVLSLSVYKRPSVSPHLLKSFLMSFISVWSFSVCRSCNVLLDLDLSISYVFWSRCE